MTNVLSAVIATLASIFLSGCSYAGTKSMPYDAWYLGFSAPAYMEVWIETADVADIRGNLFPRAMSGTASMLAPPSLSADPRGWPKRASLGKSKRVLGADLPQDIYVRWQSLVEPQTYLMVVAIPEETREIMRKGEKVFCRADGKWITGYRDSIGIRLVPGGIAKVWVGGACMEPIEVTTVQSVIDPRGPYEGFSNGEYDPPSPIPKAYVEKFGIPYDSWR